MDGNGAEKIKQSLLERFGPGGVNVFPSAEDLGDQHTRQLDVELNPIQRVASVLRQLEKDGLMANDRITHPASATPLLHYMGIDPNPNNDGIRLVFEDVGVPRT